MSGGSMVFGDEVLKQQWYRVAHPENALRQKRTPSNWLPSRALVIKMLISA